MAEDVLTTDDGQMIVADGTDTPISLDGASAWITEVVNNTSAINDVAASAIALMDSLRLRIDAALNFARIMGAQPHQLTPVMNLASAIVDNRTQLARAVSSNTSAA